MNASILALVEKALESEDPTATSVLCTMLGHLAKAASGRSSELFHERMGFHTLAQDGTNKKGWGLEQAKRILTEPYCEKCGSKC